MLAAARIDPATPPHGEDAMPTFTLTDVARDLWVESFAVAAADLGWPATPSWSVAKRVLRGGRRDGVDLVTVDNGALSFSVVPTRGMGIWRAHYRGDRVGWRSPVGDGPVNPAFVNLASGGGLGWLEGFDELLARCGLESNGPPCQEGGTSYTLHGKVANLPAHFVALHVDERPPHAITVEGRVDEARLFFAQVRMTTRITTTPGSSRLVVRDEFVNLRETPGEMQVLYHWNLGPPHMEEGARFVAPIKTVLPRDAAAAEGIGHFDVYTGPRPGVAEQVYYFELHGDGPDGRTLALLRNRAGGKGVALRFAAAQLPCFALWKAPGGAREGYVTGLEPATNYPNPRPFEKARGRVVTLDPGGTYVAETTFEALGDAQAVAAVEAEIKALQGRGAPKVHPRPVEPFAAES
jgi:hypothetical protein